MSQLLSPALQKFVNNIPLDGQSFETRNGVLIGVSQVLQVQKNRCTANTTTIVKVMGVAKELTPFHRAPAPAEPNWCATDNLSWLS